MSAPARPGVGGPPAAVVRRARPEDAEAVDRFAGSLAAAQAARGDTPWQARAPELIGAYEVGRDVVVLACEPIGARMVGVAACRRAPDVGADTGLPILVVSAGLRSGELPRDLVRRLADEAADGGYAEFRFPIAAHNSLLRAALRGVGYPEERVPAGGGEFEILVRLPRAHARL